jgi:hypothetical protein
MKLVSKHGEVVFTCQSLERNKGQGSSQSLRCYGRPGGESKSENDRYPR